jgi:acyl carrier protein
MPIISSRTPEGSPGRCPVCGRHLEVSIPFGNAPCPNCGSLLWYLNSGDEVLYIDEEVGIRLRRKLRTLLAQQLGVEEKDVPGDWEALPQLGVDSLDTVELSIQLGDELDDNGDT